MRQDSMEPYEKWADNCHCGQDPHTKVLKPLERRKKQHQRCLAHSLVGTPNYIAPEILLRIGVYYLQQQPSSAFHTMNTIVYVIIYHPFSKQHSKQAFNILPT